MACALVLAGAGRASADWLITPYIGTIFGGESPFPDFETTTGSKHTTFGGSVAWLTPQFFGLEGEFGYAPHYFESSGTAGLVSGSNLTTLMGNVIIAAPLAITHESLRPYVVGGVGLVHAGIADLIQLAPVDNNLFSFDVGGGAIGLVSNRTGFRFEVRHFRSLYSQPAVLQAGSVRFSFWRASVGVVLRY